MKKLFVLGLIMICGMSVLTGCDESTNETVNKSTITESVNPENMSDEELAEWLDGGDIDSAEWYDEHYNNN